jgi:DNA-binding FrmR family transcriptional regulator
MAWASFRRWLSGRYHTPYGIYQGMGHVTRDRDKLLNRVRRIRGQLNAVEKAIEDEQACAAVLQTLVACRGAMNSLVAQLLEEHVRYHVVDPDKNPTSKQGQAARELIDLLKTYLK